jgi:hypothetical protein
MNWFEARFADPAGSLGVPRYAEFIEFGIDGSSALSNPRLYSVS